MRTLRVTSGPLSGHSLEVAGEIVIGRQDADLTIADTELSRRHAVVRPVDGGVVVEDLGSLNGTFVDEVRIGDPVTLTRDVTIRLGRSQIALELDLAPVAPAVSDDRTRVATPVVSAPDPPAPLGGPAVTRVRPVPAPLDDAPNVTRVRPVPGGVTGGAEPGAGAAPPPPPAVTRVRPVPELDEPAPSTPTADPSGLDEPAGPGAGGEPSGEPASRPAAPRSGGLRARLRGMLRRGARP